MGIGGADAERTVTLLIAESGSADADILKGITKAGLGSVGGPGSSGGGSASAGVAVSIRNSIAGADAGKGMIFVGGNGIAIGSVGNTSEMLSKIVESAKRKGAKGNGGAGNTADGRRHGGATEIILVGDDTAGTDSKSNRRVDGSSDSNGINNSDAALSNITDNAAGIKMANVIGVGISTAFSGAIDRSGRIDKLATGGQVAADSHGVANADLVGNAGAKSTGNDMVGAGTNSSGVANTGSSAKRTDNIGGG